MFHFKSGLLGFFSPFNFAFLMLLLFLSLRGLSEEEETNLDYVPGQVLVKLRQNPEESSQESLGKLSSGQAVRVIQSLDELGVHTMVSKVGQNVEEMIETLKGDPNVIYAEPNYYLYSPPLDPSSLSEEEEGDEETNFASNEEDISPQDEEVLELSSSNSYEEDSFETSPADDSDVPIVAVIDSGVDPNYPGFIRTKALWKNKGEIPGNNRDDDGNGFVDDENGWNFISSSNSIIDDDGHGTHVAGIILRVHLGLFRRNFNYPSLSTPKLKIMNLQYSSAKTKGNVSRASAAIRYAVDNGAKIINASWTNHHYSHTLHRAIAYAYEKGAIFIASAGNDGKLNGEDFHTYPADLRVPSLISVAALDVSLSEFIDPNPNELLVQRKKRLADFSNYGINTVHLAAPGRRVKSALSSDSECPFPSCGDFTLLSGTSMAAPVVSGLASLILSYQPDLSGYSIKQNILDHAKEIEELRDILITGANADIRSIYELNSDDNFLDFSSQPKYSLEEFERKVASSKEEGGRNGFQPDKLLKQLSGCGTIRTFLDKGSKGGGKPSSNAFLIFLTLSLISLPFLVFHILYRKANKKHKRKHERFEMRSEVKISAGEQEFVGSLKTISLGGAQINTKALFEQGGVVSMKINSLDGKEQIEVQGQIVWREASKSLGVQFVGVEEQATARISSWTKGLNKV